MSPSLYNFVDAEFRRHLSVDIRVDETEMSEAFGIETDVQNSCDDEKEGTITRE